MGIENLWQALQPAARTESLLELSTKHLFEEWQGKAPQKLVLGVDANLWMVQCQQAFRVGHAQAGENPELRTLFYKLARLHKSLVDVLLVFDGPQRPSVKRGKHVVKIMPWLTERLVEFASAFGFPSYVAPGEAEAELAKLNRKGVIDAVLTEDSDAIVFGADCVFRSDKESEDGVVSFSSADIQASHQTRLTDGGLLLMALVCGGDYHDGVPGCGWRTALRLARYGLGDDLLRAATDEKAVDLASYARTWADELRMVLTRDPDGYIGRCCQCIAEAIPEDFPDPATILAYVTPITSDMETAIGLLGAPQNTDIRRLAFLCEFHFGWSRYQHPQRMKSLESTGTLGKLQSLVFEGVFLHSLYLHLRVCPGPGLDQSMEAKRDDSIGHESAVRIHLQRKAPSPAIELVQHRVEIKTGNLIKAAKRGINSVLQLGEERPAALYLDVTSAEPGHCRVWVPAPLTERALGQLLHDFTCK